MTVVAVWAPHARSMDLLLGEGLVETVPMAAVDAGWWRVDADGLRHGVDYAFRLDGGRPLPDPRSRWLPQGVHGPSRWWDPTTVTWTDEPWPGRALQGSVVYELHVGTFTPEGTLDAAAGRLDHLVDLGVGFVELMPLTAFDGDRGWGYDGVAPWSVHETYGGPDALARFVDAAHGHGLGVLLDVVHNHLGPSGNHLGAFGPYFTDTHQTPWGPAVNLDAPGSDEVRSYLVGSALSWVRDLHLDGLRLDAVHQLKDDRAVHLLEELAQAMAAESERLGRPLHLVAESDRNDPRTVTPVEQGGLGMTAQWDDDVHHALHWLLTGETDGYYADFGSAAAARAALAHGFLHAGSYSSFRGRQHGRPVPRDRVPPWRLVVSLQTHDQVGNRAAGERLSQLVDNPRLLGCGAAALLSLPYTPMLFMGEEWGAGTPWQFFSSFPDPDLAAEVTTGRREEFEEFGWRPQDVPDPQDPATRDRSVLDWAEPSQPSHAELLDWYRTLLRLRRQVPALADQTWDGFDVEVADDASWLVVSRGDVRTVVALRGDGQVTVPLDVDPVEVLAAWGGEPGLGGHEVRLEPMSAAVIRAAAP